MTTNHQSPDMDGQYIRHRHRRATWGSLCVCLTIQSIGIILAIASIGPNRELYIPFAQPIYFLEILSILVVGVLVISWILDYPRGTRSEPSRIFMPMKGSAEDEGIGIE